MSVEAAPITVEFYGIPRQRAGVAAAQVVADRLDAALAQLAGQFPALGETCFDGASLKRGYLANLNGERFITDPATPLSPGDALLILTADVGG